jgi:hypothetical protein
VRGCTAKATTASLRSATATQMYVIDVNPDLIFEKKVNSIARNVLLDYRTNFRKEI